MFQFVISIAGHVIRVRTRYELSFLFCRNFLSDAAPEFCVSVEQRDIERERQILKSLGQESAIKDPDLELQALHRLLAECLIAGDTLLMHGAAIALEGRAYLFSAPSGTGKTTHVFRWLSHRRDAFPVNGDKPFIRFYGDGKAPMACGSPWAGKERMYTGSMVPLKSVILMERAEENSIRPVSFAEAFPDLLKQVYRPENEELARKTLRLMRRFYPAVTFWRFCFNNLREDCFPTAYRALTGREP